jgi:Flp pilus assembly protein TadG
MSSRRRSLRGQSAVEFCFVLPVLLLMFMGVYTAGSAISDMNVAGQATRAGARLAAETGNYGYGTSAALTAACMAGVPTNPCAVDQDIVTSVITVSKSMKNVASFDEIDIYDPCAASGSCTAGTHLCSDTANVNGRYQSGVNPVDVYKPNGLGVWTLQGSAGYPLDLRSQAHPNERAVGVRLVYHFQASAPISFFNVQASQYTTMCFAPTESGA